MTDPSKLNTVTLSSFTAEMLNLHDFVRLGATAGATVLVLFAITTRVASDGDDAPGAYGGDSSETEGIEIKEVPMPKLDEEGHQVIDADGNVVTQYHGWTGPGNTTWRGKWKTVSDNEDHCLWEWTRVFQLNTVMDNDTIMDPINPNLKRGEWSYLLQAGGARIIGDAWAWDFSLVTTPPTEVVKTISGSGTVEVRCIRVPECEGECKQVITVVTKPEYKAMVFDWNGPPFKQAEAVGHVRVQAAVTGADATASGGVVSGMGSGDIEISLEDIKLTIQGSAGADEDICQGSDVKSKDTDHETVAFTSNAKLRCWADSPGGQGLQNECKSGFSGSKMDTTITAKCMGCCAGEVKIVVKTGWAD